MNILIQVGLLVEGGFMLLIYAADVMFVIVR